MLKALLRTFEDESVLEEAVPEYLARAKTARPQRQDQLSAVEADIRKSEDALDPAHRAHLEDLEEIGQSTPSCEEGTAAGGRFLPHLGQGQPVPAAATIRRLAACPYASPVPLRHVRRSSRQLCGRSRRRTRVVFK